MTNHFTKLCVFQQMKRLFLKPTKAMYLNNPHNKNQELIFNNSKHKK